MDATSLKERFEKILGFMDAEITLLEVENKIKTRVKKQMERSQKEYYLNEQMKAIQKELGDGDDDAEISEYMKKSKRPACLKRLRKRLWPKSKSSEI